MLGDGKIVALPTDTSWVAVCSHRSKEGIKRLRSISGERDERHFTLLCSDISQFCEFCRIDNSRFRLLKRLSPGPYVFILNTLLGTEKKLGLRRGDDNKHRKDGDYDTHDLRFHYQIGKF